MMPIKRGSAASPWKAGFKDPEAYTDLAGKAASEAGRQKAATGQIMSKGMESPKIPRPPRIKAPLVKGPQLGVVPRADTATNAGD